MANILEKPIKEVLIAMTLPAAFGMLMTFLFQLVDTYFVAQLGDESLAAISYVFPVYFLIVSFFMGIAAGVSAVVAKALGEGNREKASSLTTMSLVIFMIFTLMLGGVGGITIPHVFYLLGVSELTMSLVSDYMVPLYLGMFTLVGTLIANAALMSKGIMIKTTLVMATGGFINLILDYFLIFGNGPFPALALVGAAYASVISWCAMLALMVGLLYKEQLLSLSSLKNILMLRKQLAEVLTIATPAVAAQILNPISIAVITRLLSQYGNDAVAAYGIASRVQSLGLTIVLALSVVITPIAAQQYGAKLQTRLDHVVALSGRITVCWGIFLYIVLLLLAEPIAAIFTDSDDIVRFSRYYFYIVGASLPGFGLVLITAGFFNGVQQPKRSLTLTLMIYVMLTIPLAWIGSMMDLVGIWFGLAAANILGAIYAGKLLHQWKVGQSSSLVGRHSLVDYIDDVKGLFFRRVKK